LPSGAGTGSATRSRTIRVVAAVKDLFFVAKIRETARLAGAAIAFARTPDEIRAALAEPTDLVLLDLTTPGWDFEALFAALESAAPPVLGFTTHALARQTRPMHPRCARVITRETLTRDLPVILQEGIAA
jgi:DNA-binding NtrC family response regulator